VQCLSNFVRVQKINVSANNTVWVNDEILENIPSETPVSPKLSTVAGVAGVAGASVMRQRAFAVLSKLIKNKAK